MKMKPIIPIILLFPFVTGCGKFCKDMKLSFERQDYTGKELRTNGYYYGDFTKSDSFYYIWYLYRNGVFYQGGSVPAKDAENGVIREDIIETPVANSMLVSGAFRVVGDKIEIEGWQPTLGCHKTMSRKGKIINDSTFIITRTEYMRRNGKVDRVDTTSTVFHFHAADRKPDSTTNFVK